MTPLEEKLAMILPCLATKVLKGNCPDAFGRACTTCSVTRPAVLAAVREWAKPLRDDDLSAEALCTRGCLKESMSCSCDRAIRQAALDAMIDDCGVRDE